MLLTGAFQGKGRRKFLVNIRVNQSDWAKEDQKCMILHINKKRRSVDKKEEEDLINEK